MPNYAAMMEEVYPLLLDLMVRLVESMSGQNITPGEAWRNDAQTLALKLYRHLVSMHNLSEGATVHCSHGLQLRHIDHASIIVIARAALETYLVWHYLYGQPDPKLSKFRYLTWRLGGLMDRQTLLPVSQTAMKVQSRELVEVEALRAEIETYPQFQEFTLKQQRKLLAGDWKIALGTSDLALAAGFHGSYFNNVYGYLCGYAHASYISALQVGQAKMLEDQFALVRSIMGIGVVTMAHFSCAYPKQFPGAQAVLDADPEAKLVAERWALMADDMAETYGKAPRA